ncbi:hypothetical protein [Neolewinella antarctica]|uniref:Uncharacterized protein n=1 Tax=Neolewinella antarctica TaxID=442734 RepID=A0ABX0XGL8_9BACT|nr:hypothetical protein [Neolewinella antarctica]NJC28026.1 hypothetical protein [Neolewinella antarctica]
MHDIEPHFNWRERYRAEDDSESPFHGRVYSEFGFTNRVYNYLLHPQWDEFGAETLYMKVLFVDYDEHYAIIEMIGEWNDAVHNDSMHLKREVVDQLLASGLTKFIIIMEGVLNYHGSDTDYYEEWYEEVSDADGWIVFVNLHPQVLDEMNDTGLDNYAHFGHHLNDINWRPQKPSKVYEAIEGVIQTEQRRLY